MTSTEDYQAAEQLLRRPARPGDLVIGDKIKPQWIDGGARFGYGVRTAAGKRFVLVDPAAGIREPGLRPRPARRRAGRGLWPAGRP